MAVEGGVVEHLLDSAAEATTVVNWPGGEGVFIAEGSWNGATVTLQIKAGASGAYIAVGSSSTLTADGVAAFVAPAGAKLRAIASVAVPTAVYASIMKA